MATRWYPGYTVAAVSTVAIAMSAPAQTLLISLLNLPLRETFGIEPLTINAAYTVATIAASLPLVWVGRLIDRWGPRRMMIVVAAAFGAACVFMSLVASTWMVFLGFFLLRFCGQGSLGLVSSHAVAMWFHRRLGTIEGVRQVVLFAAWAPLPALTLRLLDWVGFRVTWAAFGVGIFVTLSFLAWRFVRDRPEELGLALDDAAPQASVESVAVEPGYSLRDALKTRAYWTLAAAAVLPPMIGTAFLFDIQPLYLQRGLDVDQAAFAVSAWSATMAVMALPAGRLVDRLSPGPIISLGTLAIGGSALLILGARSSFVMIIALVLYGLGQSLNMNAVGTTVARFFGRRYHGAIRSSMTRIGIISTGLGPLAFGLSRRFTDGYDTALAVFAAACLPVMLLCFRLREPHPAAS